MNPLIETHIIEQLETIVIVRTTPAYLMNDTKLVVVEFNNMVEAFWMN